MNKILLTALPYVVGIIALLFVLNIIMKRIGLKKSPREKRKSKALERQANKITMSEYFNPEYHLRVGAYKPLPSDLADDFARDIKRAVRWAGTDEPLLYSTFRKMYNKVNISQVAEKYQARYNDDMRADILNDLRSDKERAKLNDIINLLPEKGM